MHTGNILVLSVHRSKWLEWFRRNRQKSSNNFNTGCLYTWSALGEHWQTVRYMKWSEIEINCSCTTLQTKTLLKIFQLLCVSIINMFRIKKTEPLLTATEELNKKRKTMKIFVILVSLFSLFYPRRLWFLYCYRSKETSSFCWLALPGFSGIVPPKTKSFFRRQLAWPRLRLCAKKASDWCRSSVRWWICFDVYIVGSLSSAKRLTTMV